MPRDLAGEFESAAKPRASSPRRATSMHRSEAELRQSRKAARERASPGFERRARQLAAMASAERQRAQEL